MRAQSSAGSAASASSAAEPAKPARRHRSRGKGVSVSFHESGSISGKLAWQGRSGQLCRAATPFKFVGTAKLAGSAQVTPRGASATGHAEASGKTSGGSRATNCDAPRSPVPATPSPPPLKTPEKPEPTKGEATKRTRPNSSDIGKAPPVNPDPVARPSAKPDVGPPKRLKPKPQPDATPTAPVGPTPEELETPKEPPSEPPPNAFGYDEPVRGCFEGQVFPLAVGAKQLPTDYSSISPVSVVYACEWDIAPRLWDQGFPGIADRFEWFAIRYAGAFRIAAAGDYTFRISSDDGSKVLIDGKQVIANDGLHPPQEARGTVNLAAGDHQMVLEYFQGPRHGINLQLWVTPPGKPEELFTVR
jgi:hypothetical protein